MLEHRRHRATVLALNPVVRVQPLLHGMKALGVGVQALQIAAQLGGQVLRLDPQAPHSLGEDVQLGVGSLHRLRRPLGLRQQRRRARAVLGRDRLAPGRSRGPQAVHLAQAVALGSERGLLVLGRGELLDLLDLEGQQVQVAVARARAPAKLLEVALRLAYTRVRRRSPVAHGEMLGSAERVQQIELRGRHRELAVLVLAEEREQPAAEVAKVRRRGRAALHVRAGAPLGADPASEHHLALVRRAHALPQLCELGVLQEPGGRLERALHIGLRRPGPHDPRPRLAAQEQVERVGQHGLARARLPRDRVQPVAGPQVGPVDEQEVLDAQLQEHRPLSTSGRGRSAEGLAHKAVVREWSFRNVSLRHESE